MFSRAGIKTIQQQDLVRRFELESLAMMPASTETRPRPSTNGGVAPISQPTASDPVCPRCKAGVNRIPRRFIDRVISVVHPVHRYRCRSFICNWEGNMPCKTRVPYGSDAMQISSPSRVPPSAIAPDPPSYGANVNKNSKE
jgi:hypothetical protein